MVRMLVLTTFINGDWSVSSTDSSDFEATVAFDWSEKRKKKKNQTQNPADFLSFAPSCSVRNDHATSNYTNDSQQ